MNWIIDHYQGILLSLGIAVIAIFLGRLMPVIGGPVFGIVIGIIFSSFFGQPQSTLKGLRFTSKQILQWAIIALGAGLSLSQIYQTGISSLSVMVFTLSAAFLAAYGFGRLLGIPGKLTSLIGMGTAICGGSAIAAISPIIEAEDQEIAYAVSTVFLFNVLAVLIFPPLGHAMGFSDQAFGLWAGTAINDTSSVVASGYAFSDAAGSYATIVKLTRTTMIIPISLIFAVLVTIRKKQGNQGNGSANYSFKAIFPWFILWFLVAALFNTIGIIPKGIAAASAELGKHLIVLALSAIGLNSDFKKMRQTGFKPVLLGLIVWFTVSAVSLIVQFSTGQI